MFEALVGYDGQEGEAGSRVEPKHFGEIGRIGLGGNSLQSARVAGVSDWLFPTTHDHSSSPPGFLTTRATAVPHSLIPINSPP